MGRKIDSRIFHQVKIMQKNGKSVPETADILAVSQDTVRKIRGVGTFDMYLRRYVYPKRKGGKSYKQFKREAAQKLNRGPVNERENILRRENENFVLATQMNRRTKAIYAVLVMIAITLTIIGVLLLVKYWGVA